MLQAHYPPHLERQVGFALADWLRLLPAALGPHPCQFQDHGVRVDLAPGHLLLVWVELAPLQIALVRMPRLRVTFDFVDVPEPTVQDFMRRFDMYTHRGGG